jgi:ABC-type sugar transport system permease subunit
MSEAGAAAKVNARKPAFRGRRPELWPYVFILPMVAIVGLVFLYPLVTVVRDSFYGGSVGQLTYVGTANFINLLHDPVFVHSILNNLKLLLTVPVTIVIALAAALILYENIKGWRIYRVILFLPYIIPATVVGLSFSYLLQGNGILNTVLRNLSLKFAALDWIGSTILSIYSIGGVLIWAQLGFGVIVLTASLLSLPVEVSEAALVDGATHWQRQRFVIIPQIKETIQFLMVLEAITALAWVFPYVYTLTKGGPANSSMVMDLYIWQYGFGLGAVGLAAAAAVYLLLLSSVLIFIYSRMRRRQANS